MTVSYHRRPKHNEATTGPTLTVMKDHLMKVT